MNLNAHEINSQMLESLWLTAPMLVLIFTAMAVLVVDVLIKRSRDWWLPFISFMGVLVAWLCLEGLVSTFVNQRPQPIFFGALVIDQLSYLAHHVILGGSLVLILLFPKYLAGRAIPLGEYYAILICAVIGTMTLAASSELLTLFLNIEVLSIALYILAGLERKNVRSSEAAFKYFLLGSFAAAFLLLGIAFVFGATGQTKFDSIHLVFLGEKIIQPGFLALGFGLMFIGFGFKLTLAPFHMYAPDVYEGAPTPVTALIATVGKVGAFVAFFKLVSLVSAWPNAPAGLWIALYVVAVASMIIGNVGAVVQPNFKRLLAYSSIAHSAYTVIPMVVMLHRPDLTESAERAVAYYLLAYTVMTLLAFGVISSLGHAGEGSLRGYAGLWRRSPGLSLLLALALVSLTGIPPTIGFFGKLGLFGLAVQGKFYGLAIVGVLASVASAFYYLRVVVTMFMQEPEAEDTLAESTASQVSYVALTLCSVGLFLFAIFPGSYLNR